MTRRGLSVPVRFAGGVEARAHNVKCYRCGCKKRKSGYLSTSGEGQFYDRAGRLLANLRDQDFACSEHGIVDGSAPFLFRDDEVKR